MHAIYRLGANMVVRLPIHTDAIGQAQTELRWLSKMALALPLTVPIPLVLGNPTEEYPWPWAVYRWIDGKAAIEGIADKPRTAVKLAQFLSALQRMNTSGGPPSGRGTTLVERDSFTRTAIESLKNVIDTDAAAAVWENSLQAAPWNAPLVWTHGDLFPSNMLVDHGELCAIIDFGDFGLGDPACDMLGAWSLFSSETRGVFRTELEVDEATWERGRGWAFSISVVALWHYRNTNPQLTAMASNVIDEIIADHNTRSSKQA
jgi:aminoglycoside phosphotransferase (APT) family kinase protein